MTSSRTRTAAAAVLVTTTRLLLPAAAVTRLVVERPAVNASAITLDLAAPAGVTVRTPPLTGDTADSSRTTPVVPVAGTPFTPATVTAVEPWAGTTTEASARGATV